MRAGRARRTFGAEAARSRAGRAVLAGLFVVAAACAGGDVPAGDADGASRAAAGAASAGAPDAEPPAGSVRSRESRESPALPGAMTSADHQRFQRLNAEVLRLMIAAARRALPIGPFQQRISAARTAATRDIGEAADRMEAVVADLEDALAKQD